MITIRPVEAADWSLARSIRLAALADAPYAFAESLDRARDHDDQFWRRRVADNARGVSTTCVLALDGERPAGMAVGIRDTDLTELAFLAGMWVAPAYRGGETTPRLVSAIARWAADGGATRLAAGVTRENTRAERAYRKLGFVDAPQLSGHGPATRGCALVLAMPLPSDADVSAR